MTLVWHILRKDFRHTWMYSAAAAALLLIFVATFQVAVRMRIDSMLSLFRLQNPINYVLVASWALLCGAVIHAEALPGHRPYWLTRPVRWQHLLRAKSLLLIALVAVPMAGVHFWMIASRGLPVLEELGALVWNALLLAIVCLVPVAVVASVTRNLQQLILCILGITGGIVALRLVQSYPNDSQLLWVPTAVSVVAGTAAGVAILVWQYATRNSKAGRIAAIAYFLALASLELWPTSVWYALQRAASPVTVDQTVGRLTPIESGLTWHRFRSAESRTLSGTLEIPLRVEGLPEGWSVELNTWSHLRIVAGDETVRESALSARPHLLGAGLDRSFSVGLSPAFADRNSHHAMDVSITSELTLYGPAQQFDMDVQDEKTIPGLGRCRSQTGEMLSIACESVFESNSRATADWTTGTPGKPPLTLMRQAESRVPFRLIPTMHPLALSVGGFGAKSDYSNGRIVISTRKPMAYVQRTIDLHGIRLDQIER
jgi:hypothetical protein